MVLTTVWALLVAGFGFVAAPADAASAPAGLKVVNTSSRAFAVSWKAVSKAAGYRVRISKSSSMSNPQTMTVDTNYAEWTRMSGNPTDLTAARLKPATTYYVQVKSLNASRGDLSGYSAKLKVKTKAATALPEVPPAGLKGTVADGTSLYLSWRSNGPGVLYRVRYGTKSSLPDGNAKTAVFSQEGGTITGLNPGTKYYFKVRVLSSARANLSNYSSVVSATTGSASAVPGLVVVSHNVLRQETGNKWENRRDAVVANILGQGPDILGLQEATGTAVTTTDGKSVTQYADLLSRLGDGYKYVSTTGTAGTRLAYRTARLTLVSSGTAKLTTALAAQRYAVWAVLKDNLDQKQVFVLNTHLEPPPASGATAADAQYIWETRTLQVREVMELIAAKNTAKLPVVVTGDMNSSRANKPTNAAYQEFVARGLADPLGNADDLWFRLTPATTEHSIGNQYNSFNNLETKARRTTYPVGTHVDYILVTGKIRVATYQTVVSLDTAGKFVSTPPSDHNLIKATIHLK